MGKHSIDYRSLSSLFLRTTKQVISGDERRAAFTAFLFEKLPDLWCQTYRRMPNGKIDIVQVTDGGYNFLFDLGAERVIAAFGTSRFNPVKRDASRMAGFLGSTFREQFFKSHGDKFDRGHFMSHRQGGGLDINLFPQLADINQGRSELGKIYRAMERACVANTGTFCFSRPIYDDETWVPAELDYGMIFTSENMDLATFPNK